MMGTEVLDRRALAFVDLGLGLQVGGGSTPGECH